MTTAEHRHDTDPADTDATHYDGAVQTDYEGGREPGGYGAAHDTVATEDERHLDEDTHGAEAHGDSDPGHTDGTDPARTEDVTAGTYSSRHAEDDSAVDDSAVDDAAVDDAVGGHEDTVSPVSPVGDGTPGTAVGSTAGSTAGSNLERLVASNRVDEYTSRWDAVKGEFVDEPRQAVAKADKLVGELLDELDQLFRKQRSDLEHSLDADETSTEDLRLAMRKYRSFFDRLLTL